MPAFIDITGQRFGRLVAVAYEKPSRWLCHCDCGRETIVQQCSLRNNVTKSCGCLRVELARSRATKHGYGRKRQRPAIYSCWVNMMTRCTNPNSSKWKDYGGRGISVCVRWRHSFESFLADMGEKPAGLTLDRIDNDGNYEPSNCRWATPSEQRINSRRPQAMPSFW
jgi:hypothetical protein